MIRTSSLRASAVIGVLAGATFATHAADVDPEQLLVRMSQAVEQSNYAGVFVYQRGAQTDSMRIVHQHQDGMTRERLVSLSGSAREVIRDGDTVTCIYPEQQALMLESGHPQELFPSSFNLSVESMRAYYHFTVEGRDRVAGRSVYRVAIDPKFPDRYGYRLWIDVESQLLLKSTVLDSGGQVLEHVMFTQLDLNPSIDPADLRSELDTRNYRVVRSEPPRATHSDLWSVGWLPSGFQLREHPGPDRGASASSTLHLVFSDGLAMVSIFVEPLQDGRQTLQGYSAMGAVNAYSMATADHQVTVVGEVPQTTVRQIATSVVRVEATARQ